jgi:hypothetical protein
MVPGWPYQARRTLSQKRSSYRRWKLRSCPRDRFGEVVGVGCPGAHQGAELPLRRDRDRDSFFIVRDFFSFALFAEVSGWPSVSSTPPAPEGEPGHMPVTTPACPEAAIITPAYLRVGPEPCRAPRRAWPLPPARAVSRPPGSHPNPNTIAHVAVLIRCAAGHEDVGHTAQPCRHRRWLSLVPLSGTPSGHG